MVVIAAKESLCEWGVCACVCEKEKKKKEKHFSALPVTAILPVNS